MNITLITGIIGIAMLVAFVGFMLIWVPALPLIVIVGSVLILVLVDFFQTLRSGESGA